MYTGCTMTSPVPPPSPGSSDPALNRGEKEGFLKLSLDLPGAQGAALVCRHALKPQKTVSAFVKAAAEDAYARLIAPAAERELRNDLTGRASKGHSELLPEPEAPAAAAGQRGRDHGPGSRLPNGCKVAVVDPTRPGADTAVVYLTGSQKKQEEARARLLSSFKPTGWHIAIGNGTASRGDGGVDCGSHPADARGLLHDRE